MHYLNGHDHEILKSTSTSSASVIRQLVTTKEVAHKLGVSVSWVIQHASGKRKPYLPAVKMGPGRSPLRFDPEDVERFIDECDGSPLNAPVRPFVEVSLRKNCKDGARSIGQKRGD